MCQYVGALVGRGAHTILFCDEVRTRRAKSIIGIRVQDASRYPAVQCKGSLNGIDADFDALHIARRITTAFISRFSAKGGTLGFINSP